MRSIRKDIDILSFCKWMLVGQAEFVSHDGHASHHADRGSHTGLKSIGDQFFGDFFYKVIAQEQAELIGRQGGTQREVHGRDGGDHDGAGRSQADMFVLMIPGAYAESTGITYRSGECIPLVQCSRSVPQNRFHHPRVFLEQTGSYPAQRDGCGQAR
jgi:hypothetical protein